MSKLFSPIQLGGLELSNRVVVSPMCQYSAVEGVAQPWHTVHIGTCAISGAGLVILEATGVEAIGRISPYCLGLYNDQQEAALAKLVREIRTFSPTPLGIQLAHAGRKAGVSPNWQGGKPISLDQGGWETVGPSAVAFGEGWRVPRELDEAGLAAVRDAFVDAARRADRCGFDLIELHGAHGYLLSQFTSPLANFRTDRYGGNLENRLRFPLEVVSAVRAAWPRAKALGIRINGSDWHERGITLDETVVFARALKEAGVDYVTTSGGNSAPEINIPPIVPGYMVHFAERVRREAEVPTMTVGMVLFPHQAEAILASGHADVVGLGRAILDNPRWGWHAANALGVEGVYPRPYTRARPARWPGYDLVHQPA